MHVTLANTCNTCNMHATRSNACYTCNMHATRSNPTNHIYQINIKINMGLSYFRGIGVLSGINILVPYHKDVVKYVVSAIGK